MIKKIYKNDIEFNSVIKNCERSEFVKSVSDGCLDWVSMIWVCNNGLIKLWKNVDKSGRMINLGIKDQSI